MRQLLIDRLWRGRDPLANFPAQLYATTPNELTHGPHPFLLASIERAQPKIVVEIGVWKGASSIAMARHMKALGLHGSVVVCVDTWLGAWDHWINDDWYPGLAFEHGQPMLMRTFMSNVIATRTQDVILPLPLDSVNAHQLLERYDLQIDIIHIDGGHDYRAVTSDLEMWWPMIRPGGWLVGDDYVHDGNWPEVRRAFDDFYSARQLFPFEHAAAKCRIQKPQSTVPAPVQASA